MTDKNVSMFGRIIPGLVLGFLVLLVLILLGDMAEVSARIQHFEWVIIPIVLLLTLLNYFLRILKWHFSLGRTGVKSLSFANSAQLFLAAFPLTVTHSKVGQALKGVWLKQKGDIPIGRSALLMAADQVSDWLVVLGLSVLGVIAYPAFWPVFLFVLLALLAIIALGPEDASLDSWGGLEKHFPALPDAVVNLRQQLTGGLSIYRPLPGVFVFVLGFLSWLGEGICLYLILIGTGLDGGVQLLISAIWITALSSLIGAISTLPGGLGATEVALAASLTLFTGLPPSLATVATVLFRLTTFWFKIGIGLIVWRFSPNLSGLRTKNGTVVES